LLALPIHAGFESERIENVHLVPDNDPSCIKFLTVLIEPTGAVVKRGLMGAEDLREKSSFSPTQKTFIRSFVASVNEAIIKLVVAMQIAEDRNAISLLQHPVLNKKDFRVQHGVRLSPSSVQVNSCKRTAAISHCDPINIDHWNKPYNVLI
jgi:hypothetical protein